jgi:hypothetical protein
MLALVLKPGCEEREMLATTSKQSKALIRKPKVTEQISDLSSRLKL